MIESLDRLHLTELVVLARTRLVMLRYPQAEPAVMLLADALNYLALECFLLIIEEGQLFAFGDRTYPAFRGFVEGIIWKDDPVVQRPKSKLLSSWVLI